MIVGVREIQVKFKRSVARKLITVQNILWSVSWVLRTLLEFLLGSTSQSCPQCHIASNLIVPPTSFNLPALATASATSHRQSGSSRKLYPFCAKRVNTMPTTTIMHAVERVKYAKEIPIFILAVCLPPIKYLAYSNRMAQEFQRETKQGIHPSTQMKALSRQKNPGKICKRLHSPSNIPSFYLFLVKGDVHGVPGGQGVRHWCIRGASWTTGGSEGVKGDNRLILE